MGFEELDARAIVFERDVAAGAGIAVRFVLACFTVSRPAFTSWFRLRGAAVVDMVLCCVSAWKFFAVGLTAWFRSLNLVVVGILMVSRGELSWIDGPWSLDDAN